jgi:hypothetical protein
VFTINVLVLTINSALQRTTVVNGSTPDAAIGNEETMDKLSITLLQQLFDIHIPSELQSQSEHKRQRHKQRQHRLKQLQGVEHDSDSDVQELEDSGIHTTLGMAAALVATLNSSNHSNNAELPAPPCDTPITSIPLPKVNKRSDGRKKSTDSNSGYSNVADTGVAPECTDDLLALLRLPLVSKQDVIKLLQQSIDEQQQQQNSDDSSSTATATTEQHSSGSSSSSTDGAHTAVHEHDATGDDQTAAAGTTADSSGQQQKQKQQRRSIKVELFSTDAISTLLTAIERGEGKGRLHMPLICDEQWYDGSNSNNVNNSSSNSSAFNSTNTGQVHSSSSNSNAYDADTSVHGSSSNHHSKDAAKSRHPKLSTLLSKRR